MDTTSVSGEAGGVEEVKKLCRKSGKVKFDSHESASKRAGEVLNAPKRLSDPAKRTTQLSTYVCPHCGKWHLTKGLSKVVALLILLPSLVCAAPIVSVLSFKGNVIINGQHVNQLVTSCSNTIIGHSYLWERNTTGLDNANAWVPLTGFSGGGGVAVRTNGIPVDFKFAYFRVRDTTP